MIDTSAKTHTAKASVLVTASQGVEASIVDELKVRGFSVKVLARNSKMVEKITTDDSEVVEAVVSLPSTLEGNLKGIHIIVSTLCMSKKEKGLFNSLVDYQSTINLLNEAQQAGVKKFIYLSPVASRLDQCPKILKANNHFLAKLKASNMDYTIVRLNEILVDSAGNLIRAQKRKPFHIPNKKQKIDLVHPKNLAIACVTAIKKSFLEISVEETEISPLSMVQEKSVLLNFNITKKVQIAKYLYGSLRYLRRGFKPSTYNAIFNSPPKASEKGLTRPDYGNQPVHQFTKNKQE